MQRDYRAHSNQTILDICLNTYGSFRYLGKLMKDNGVYNPLYNTSKNSIFVYDDALITDVLIYNQGKTYATATEESMLITDKTKSVELLVGTDIANGNTFAISQLINSDVLLVFVGGTQIAASATEGYSFNKTTGTLDFTVIGGLSNVRLTVLYNEA